MSRRRYISTDISTDIKLANLAEYGSTPLLLYTWSIPHMDDWGRITGEPRQFKLMVCPALDLTVKDIDAALDQIENSGLWIRYEVDGKRCICIPEEQWFKHQSYINKAKRSDDSGSNYPSQTRSEEHRKSPQITEEQQELPKNAENEQDSAQNTASFSFSLSSSPSLSKSSSSSSEREILSVGDAFTYVTGKLAMPGTFTGIISDMRSKGCSEEMMIEAMLEAGECADGGNPSAKYYRSILEGWQREGIINRQEAKERKQKPSGLPKGPKQAVARHNTMDKLQELYNKAKEEEDRAANGGY